MTMRLVKSGKVWSADGNGHVLDSRFFRELKREGAVLAALSREQWEGYFGRKAPEDPRIDKIPVVRDDSLKSDEVHFFSGADELMCVMRRLYVKDGKQE